MNSRKALGVVELKRRSSSRYRRLASGNAKPCQQAPTCHHVPHLPTQGSRLLQESIDALEGGLPGLFFFLMEGLPRSRSLVDGDVNFGGMVGDGLQGLLEQRPDVPVRGEALLFASFSMFRCRSFSRKRSATPTSASRGQAWKTSSTMQLIRAWAAKRRILGALPSLPSLPSPRSAAPGAGNLRPRIRKVEPTGEWQSTKCKFEPGPARGHLPFSFFPRVAPHEGPNELCPGRTGRGTSAVGTAQAAPQGPRPGHFLLSGRSRSSR